MIKKFYLGFFLIILLLGILDAKIILVNEPEEIYNLNDFIYLDFYIERQTTSFGYIEAKLICDKKESVIFKKGQTVYANNQTNISFTAFAHDYGDCQIKLSFDESSLLTGKFIISDKIDISYSLNNRFFLAGEKLIINATAIKKNKELSEGIAEISLGNLFNRTVEIKQGYFFSEFIIPENAAPGNYTLLIKAIENQNTGLIQERIQIKSSPFSIQIITNDSIKPPENLTVQINLLDQIAKPIKNTSLLVRIFDPENNLITEKTILSGDFINLELKENAIRGSWKINSYYGKIYHSYPVYVLENKQISFKLIPNPAYVNITNIGNSEYNGIVEVFVENQSGNLTIPLNINLSIGESKKYPLEIKGEYNLTIEGREFKNIKITGAAISLDSGLNSNIFVVFVIFFLLLGILLFIIYRKKIPHDFLDKYFLGFFKNLKIKTKNNLQQGLTEQKEKTIFVAFFNSNNQNLIEKFSKKLKYPLQKISSSLCFLIVYSSDLSLKNDLLSLSRKIMKKSQTSSIVLHCEKFQGKISSINSALIAKDIVKNVSGLYLTENFYRLFNSLNYKSRKEITIKEKNTTIYEVNY